MALRYSLAELLLFQALLYLWAATPELEEFLEWIHALCCSSSLASPSSQSGGAFAMLVFDVQMLWTGMMSAGSSSARDDNPRIMRHVSQETQMRETSQHSQVAQRRAGSSSGEIDPSTCLTTRVTPLSLAARVAFAPPSLWSRLPLRLLFFMNVRSDGVYGHNCCCCCCCC